MKTPTKPCPAAAPAAVKTAMRRHIGDASRALDSPALPDDAIHRARKLLKAARSGLRLLRPALRKRDYRRENDALRDAARPLSGARDAAVMVQTLDDLAQRETDPARQALLRKLRGMLEQRRLEAVAGTSAEGTAAASAAALEKAWERVEHTHLQRSRPAAVCDGLKRIYRGGRKAYAVARAEPTPDNLHEWRKQVKYLRNAIELASPDASALQRLAHRADAIAQHLGDDHDLVVLQSEIVRLQTGASGARARLFAQIADRRTELQSKAFKKGRGLFRRKPAAFIRHLAKAGSSAQS